MVMPPMQQPQAQQVSAASGPVAAGERLGLLDLLRGFALLGILLVNMPFFNTPIFEAALGTGAGRFTGGADQFAAWLIAWLAESKFYVIFSFLFGYGLAVQLARAATRGESLVPRYLRRLLGLFVIGLLHATLFFIGDILVLYAVLGLLLLLFRAASPRALLSGAAVAFGVAVFLNTALALLTAFTSGAEGAIDLAAATRAAETAYRTGSFGEVAAQRVRELGFLYAFLPFVQAPTAFAMFLLGLWAGKAGVFARVAENAPLFRRVLRWGLIVGLPGGLFYATVSQFFDTEESAPLYAAAFVVETFAAPLLGAAYVSAWALLTRNPARSRRFAPLEALGKMSLTNYLLQSVVCSLIFNGYGLGWYGQTGPAAGVLLAVGIWLAQIPLSVLWFRWFRIGPVEWLLRSFTYLRFQSFRAAR